MTAATKTKKQREIEDILAEMVAVIGELQELLPAYLEERSAKEVKP
jgi:hypothetical protein